MPASPSSGKLGQVVARLRAAGCVFAEDEALLMVSEARDSDHLREMVGRRSAGEPLEHVLGWAAFCGLRIAVDRGVFVPRPRTELLVRQAVSRAQARPVVVDLCCGSGAVGAALLAAREDAELYAVDIDPAAVACAQRNLAGRAKVFTGDLFQPLPDSVRGRVDILVANVPYVPTRDVALLPAEARLFEPRRSLDGGPDGLDVLRRVADGARRWLAPGGHLLVETSAAQAARAAETMAGGGLAPEVITEEDLDATVVVGTRPPSTYESSYQSTCQST